MNKLVVIVGFARCGVTLINRYLASDKQLVCLAEINSRYVCPTEPNTIRNQLRDWYDVSIDRGLTIEELGSALIFCESSHKTLLVRDWSFGSFVPLKYNDFDPPKKLNTLDDIKANLGVEVDVFAVVRNPVDVWLSMNNSAKTFHDKKLEYYNNFVDDIIQREIPVFKYEDFCENKNQALNDIYKIIGKEMPNDLTLSLNVIGDINYPSSSRGASENSVCILERRGFSEEDLLFMKNRTHINNILQKLSYEDRI
jgi:hypothetical protein